MRCSQAQILINDHVDHLLDRRKVEKLEGHLQKCPRCRDLLAEMLSMVNEAKQLEMTPPSEDLWPAIRTKIEGKHREAAIRLREKRPFSGFSRYPARWAYAVSTLLVTIILVSLFYYGFPFIRNEKNDLGENELDHFKVAEQHYQTAIEALDKAISDRSAKLSPELAAVFKTNLEIIDNSIRACQAVMGEHRENRVANAHLLICYRKKMELLNEIKNITMQSS
jgi:predicted anti-sigma-YlaC factor YlaD